MDEFIKVESRVTKLVINNDGGSCRQLDIELRSDEKVSVLIEYDPRTETGSIGSIPFSKLQKDLIIEFLSQK